MEKITTAKQYAKALFDACREKLLIDQVASELKILEDTMHAESELYKLLIHPEIPIDEKELIIKQVLNEEFTPVTNAFIKLLVKHQKLELLPVIHQIFIRLRFEAFGLLKALVQTSRPISSISKNRLTDALKKATQREVIITEELHPELIGGVRIVIGDRILDASIIGQLDRLKEKILLSETIK
jgi:ATP synthase F1 delta subunit